MTTTATRCCGVEPYRDGVDGGWYCSVCDTAVCPGRFAARDLRVVSNVTREWDGGFTIELRDGSIVAGPYATREDAKRNKANLLAGRPVETAG